MLIMNTNSLLWMLCFGHCAVCFAWRHIWLAQEVCNGTTLTSSLEQAISVLPLPVPPYTHTLIYKHTLVFTHMAPLLSLYHPSVRKKACNTFLILPSWDTNSLLTLNVWCVQQDAAVLQMPKIVFLRYQTIKTCMGPI